METRFWKYLYCVIENSPDKKLALKGPGISGGKVHIVNYRDLAMLTSNVSESMIDPTAKNTLAHEKVVAEALGSHTVLPMRFGVIVPDRKEIVRLLKVNYAELSLWLKKLHNKIELGLTISWEEESFIRDICQVEPEVETLREQIAASLPEQVYPLQIRLGQLVESVVEQKRAEWQELVIDCLAPGAEDFKISEPIGERMLFRGVFLVSRDKEEEFDKMVDQFYLKNKEGLIYKYSGPWPPYNFTKFRLESE